MPRGPLPLVFHALADPIVGAFMLAAPWIFGFNDDAAALTISLVAGAVLLTHGLTTNWQWPSLRVLPVEAHFWGDVALGLVLLASPFIFGFDDVNSAAAIFFAVGGADLFAALSTNWSEARPPRSAARRTAARRSGGARRTTTRRASGGSRRKTTARRSSGARRSTTRRSSGGARRSTARRSSGARRTSGSRRTGTTRRRTSGGAKRSSSSRKSTGTRRTSGSSRRTSTRRTGGSRSRRRRS